MTADDFVVVWVIS